VQLTQLVEALVAEHAARVVAALVDEERRGEPLLLLVLLARLQAVLLKPAVCLFREAKPLHHGRQRPLRGLGLLALR
jgi:hypothetical protein